MWALGAHHCGGCSNAVWHSHFSRGHSQIAPEKVGPLDHLGRSEDWSEGNYKSLLPFSFLSFSSFFKLYLFNFLANELFCTSTSVYWACSELYFTKPRSFTTDVFESAVSSKPNSLSAQARPVPPRLSYTGKSAVSEHGRWTESINDSGILSINSNMPNPHFLHALWWIGYRRGLGHVGWEFKRPTR